MPTVRQHPIIRELERDACIELLARNQVGRMAFSFHDRIDIQPLHYVYDDGWLYGRTSVGSKLETLEHHQWVAFEVDEIRAVFDWTSVVVHGAFRPIDPFGTRREQKIADHAVALLRGIVADTLTANDPVPLRTILFRVSVDEVSGREAYSGE